MRETASCRFAMERWAYRLDMASVLWPRSSAMFPSDMPDCRNRLAKVWRRSCHRKSWMPAARTACGNQCAFPLSVSPAAFRTTRPLPSARDRKIRRARIASSFRRTWTGALFCLFRLVRAGNYNAWNTQTLLDSLSLGRPPHLLIDSEKRRFRGKLARALEISRSELFRRVWGKFPSCIVSQMVVKSDRASADFWGHSLWCRVRTEGLDLVRDQSLLQSVWKGLVFEQMRASLAPLG